MNAKTDTRTAQFAADEARRIEGQIKYNRVSPSLSIVVDAFKRIATASNPEAQLETELSNSNQCIALNMMRLRDREGRLTSQASVDAFYRIFA